MDEIEIDGHWSKLTKCDTLFREIIYRHIRVFTDDIENKINY